MVHREGGELDLILVFPSGIAVSSALNVLKNAVSMAFRSLSGSTPTLSSTSLTVMSALSIASCSSARMLKAVSALSQLGKRIMIWKLR